MSSLEADTFCLRLRLQDKKYSYLWNCRDALDKAIKVVIATDNDEPGYALGEELSRRLGRERCYRVRWPSSEDDTILIDDPQQQEAAPGSRSANPWQPSTEFKRRKGVCNAVLPSFCVLFGGRRPQGP